LSLTGSERQAEILLCVVLSDTGSLLQKGGSWATNLGRPAYPRPKGTGDQSMPEKRGTKEVSESEPRKTRMAGPRLNGLKSNPDRPILRPVTQLTPRDAAVCVAMGQRVTQAQTAGYRRRSVGRRDEWTA
jgi:hypothetical protein